MRSADLAPESTLWREPATAEFLESENVEVLESYAARQSLIEEHARQEIATAEGAYGRRQVFELVQNAADAIGGSKGGRIEVILTADALYCANTGKGFSKGGLRAILQVYLSGKADREIGRYGLGFKSVLGVTERTEIYSDTVSLRFDPEWSAEKIRRATGYQGETPKLRLARPVTREEALAGDPVLSELGSWATTIVKLPFGRGEAQWLHDNITMFPVEFLLFSPQVKSMVLEDRTKEVRRELTSRRSDPVQLIDCGKASSWMVFSRRLRPTAAAIADGGVFAGRKEVDVSWAVPVRGGQSDGLFWSFFPMRSEAMSLKGILNAPWKLNDDRQNILEGEFNDYLLDEASRLVLSKLEHLVDSSDPGKLLEIFPARLDERVGADHRLTVNFYSHAADFPTVPDSSSTLRRSSELSMHPKGLPDGALAAWRENPVTPSGWAHPSTVSTTTRSARIDQLAVRGASERASITEWLEALVTGTSAEHNGAASPDEVTAACSAKAILAAAELWKVATPQVQSEILQARIVLTSDGRFVCPRANAVFLPAAGGASHAGVDLVHERVVQLDELVGGLATLKIHTVDASSELKALLDRRGLLRLSGEDWPEIWDLVSKIEADVETQGRSGRIIADHCGESFDPRFQVYVRNLDGQYRVLANCLLPGEVVPGDGSRDTAVAIDTEFHREHLKTLTELGAVEVPTSSGGSRAESWFDEYFLTAKDMFYESLSAKGSRPHDYLIVFREERFPGPLEPLQFLSDEGRVLFTSHLILQSEATPSWTVAHSTRSDTYPDVSFDSPAWHMIRRHGLLKSSKGPCKPSLCVADGLREWSRFLPVVASSSEAASILGLPREPEEIDSARWDFALESAASVSEPTEIGGFYAQFCTLRPAPRVILSLLGGSSAISKPTQTTVVPNDPNVIEAMQVLRVPFVVVQEASQAEALVTRWGLLPSAQLVEVETKGVESGSPTPLGDFFTALTFKLTSDQAALLLKPCSSLRKEIRTEAGTRSEELDFALVDGALLYSDGIERAALLERVLEQIGIDLDPIAREDILLQVEDDANRQRVADIAAMADLESKLLACVGCDVLRNRLSEALLTAAESRIGPLDDKRIAQLFLAVFGVESLELLKEELRDTGLPAPIQWAGSFRARKFVRDLGFPPEYAGFQRSERRSALDVDGPPNLPKLHTFQEKVVAHIKSLLLANGRKKRGLLSLPTGAGKTRVAVEAVIRTVRDDGFLGPVLWVAQSDELCEQAVQTWSEVWRAIGPRTALRINRLWGQNQADPFGEGFQVVVATIQKLQYVKDELEYEWLKECEALIVDEAHHSVTPSYTAILEWVGMVRSADRCPILGLTATAFRGGEQETERLIKRYGGNRLDQGVLGDDAYTTLQAMGVLADVDHELLDGVDVDLSPEEIHEIERLRRLPSSVGDRLTASVERNVQLLKSIRALPEDWPVLVFAVSVAHAQTVAALLEADGIRAAAVSAETATGARRHYVEQFRSGGIRVLTNYGVLTTGFDAPAVRALYVARPVFSPVLYQQMIGRGLRGPMNGGKERCLIVNVEDNFDQFGSKLAFSDFEFLWERSP